MRGGGGPLVPSASPMCGGGALVPSASPMCGGALGRRRQGGGRRARIRRPVPPRGGGASGLRHALAPACRRRRGGPRAVAAGAHGSGSTAVPESKGHRYPTPVPSSARTTPSRTPTTAAAPTDKHGCHGSRLQGRYQGMQALDPTAQDLCLLFFSPFSRFWIYGDSISVSL